MKEVKFVDRIKKDKREVVIYGAGMVGELVYKRLCSNALLPQIRCFAVTAIEQEKEYLGLPIYAIDELADLNVSVTVIVATLPELHDEMLCVLNNHAFKNIIRIDRELYNDLSKHYIQEFQEKRGNIAGKKKILFMSSDNNSSSGAFLSMVNLNTDLNRCGISTLVVLPEYGNGEQKLIEKQVDYTYVQSEHWCIGLYDRTVLKKIKSLVKNFSAIRTIRKLIRDNGVEIVHCNTTYTYVGSVAGQRENVPVIWHLRENLKEQGMRFINYNRCIKAINQSRKIIVISKYLEKCLSGLNRAAVRVVYNGIDIEKFYVRKEILIDKDHVIISLIGAVTAHKGQEILIQAAYILKKRGFNNFVIRIIGKANQDYLVYLRNLIKKYNLENEVIFWGRQNNIEQFYRESDIVVVCSVAEPFGRVTVEGQVSGCLVIGANSGATPELIQDRITGMLYEQDNSEDLANCIMEAMENVDMSRNIARQGQEYAHSVYSKENNSNEIIKVYEEVLGRKAIL